jgi:Invasin, domain 3
VYYLPLALPLIHPLPLIAIELQPEKTVIRADGRSLSAITARVFDDRGAAVPDGTRVQFSTTVGRLSSQSVETRGGLARVTLTAADQPGTATITASVELGGGIPARTQVTFSNDGQAADLAKQWLRFTGSAYVSLAVVDQKMRVVDVLGKMHDARASFGDITVLADHLQYRLGATTVYAEGNVILELNKKRKRFHRLAFDLVQQVGIAETAAGRIELKGDLQQNPLPPSDTPGWQFVDLGDAPLVVAARSIGINQEGVLQFRNATFYLQGQKTFSTPFHVMTTRQQSLYREQLVGVGASGVWLNLPYYYTVQPQGVGTLFLRRGAPFGSSVYSQRQGWTLDLEQSYNTYGNGEGQVQVLNLAQRGRGLRLQHNQKLDSSTDANVFMDWVGGRDLFGSSQIGHNFSAFRLNVSAALNRYQGFIDPATNQAIPASGDWRIQTAAESYPLLLAPRSKVRYTLTATQTDQHFLGGQSTLGTIQTRNLGTRLYTDPLKIDARTSLTQSGVLGYTWVQAAAAATGIGRSGISVQTTTALSQPVQYRSQSLGSWQVRYDYFQTPPLFVATGTTSATRQGRQRLSATTTINKGEQSSFSFSGSRGLDVFQSTIFAEARTALRGPWFGRVRVTDTQFSAAGFTDVECALIRMINGREVALYYSTIARRFQLDLTGLSF